MGSPFCVFVKKFSYLAKNSQNHLINGKKCDILLNGKIIYIERRTKK